MIRRDFLKCFLGISLWGWWAAKKATGEIFDDEVIEVVIEDDVLPVDEDQGAGFEPDAIIPHMGYTGYSDVVSHSCSGMSYAFFSQPAASSLIETGYLGRVENTANPDPVTGTTHWNIIDDA